MGKPWPIPDFNHSQPLDLCVKKILRTRSAEVFSYEHSVLVDGAVDAVHDMRVAARRLHSVLRVFRPRFPRKKLKQQQRTLVSLIRALGKVREEDITIGIIEEHIRTTPEAHGKALNLLLAQRLGHRQRDLRRLHQEIVRLNDDGYAKHLQKFIERSLGNN